MLRRACAALALALLTACSSSSSPKDAAAPDATGSSASTSTAPSAGRPTATAGATTAASAAPSTAATAGTTTGGGTSGGSTGTATTVRSTPAGDYTYDSSGSQTISGASQQVDATSTLTISALQDGQQSSTLHNSQGDTTQQLVMRSSGSFLAALTISSPTLKTSFHLSPPVLLLPDPGKPGTTWSWHATSDDGKTTVTADNEVLRTETLTVGGERVATVVLQTHLVVTGQSVHYTADATNWVAPSYRLPVKTHTKGSGTYGTFAFSFDVTDVLRSVHPS